MIRTFIASLIFGVGFVGGSSNALASKCDIAALVAHDPSQVALLGQCK
jgi:hypothetical protein